MWRLSQWRNATEVDTPGPHAYIRGMSASTTRIKRRHPRRCGHCVSVDAYRAARIAAELAREEATRGWATEIAEYPTKIITFKDWLIMTAGSGVDYYQEAA